jgi:hypothetical protein
VRLSPRAELKGGAPDPCPRARRGPCGASRSEGQGAQLLEGALAHGLEGAFKGRIVRPLAAQHLARGPHAHRTRGNRHDDGVGVGDRPGLLEVDAHRDAEQREIDRAPLAQLAVRTAVERRGGGNVDRDQDLVRLDALVDDPVGDPEVVDRHGSRAARARDLEHRIQGHQGRRGIVGGRGDALVAFLDHVANGAVLLEAKAQGLAPEVGLVVPLAAGVEQDVASERAHGPQLGARDQSRRLSQGGRARGDELARGDLRQGRHRADPEPARVRRAAVVVVAVVIIAERHAAQLRKPLQRHQHLRREELVLHVGQEVRAPGDDHGAPLAFRQGGQSLGQSARRKELELRQPQHQLFTGLVAACSRSRNALRTTEGVNGRCFRRIPTAS